MRNLYLFIGAVLMTCLSSNAQCITNGNFEGGLAGLNSNYTFKRLNDNIQTYSHVDCYIDTNTPDFVSFTPGAVNDFNFESATLVSNASLAGFGTSEPFLFSAGVSTVPRVQSGSGTFAIKLNRAAAGSDIVSMTTNITPNSTSVSFNYSLIVQQHGSDNSTDDVEAFFTARIFNADNEMININDICMKPDPDNLNIYREVNFGGRAFYSGWRCGRLDIPQEYVGKNLRLEFVMADCGGSAHFGTVYIDDISCGAACSAPAFGMIKLDPINSVCANNNVNVCGTYIAPINSTLAPQGFTLELIDTNGNTVYTDSNPTTVTSNTFCFNVNPSVINIIGSFEVKVNGYFNSPSSPPNQPTTYHLFDTSANPGADITFGIIDSSATTVQGDYLIWPDIADSYELQFVSDNTCCPRDGGPEGGYYAVTVTTNQINLWDAIMGVQAKCFRWRIKPSCGVWSEWCCLTTYRYGEPPYGTFTNALSPKCYDGEVPCEDELYQSVAVLAFSAQHELRSNFVVATNIIEPNAAAVYQAGNFVELKEGFNSQTGSVFIAEIENCSPDTTGPRPRKKSNVALETPEDLPMNFGKSMAEFTVYPNPVDGLLTIMNNEHIKVYTIIDITGKELVRFNNSDYAHEVSINVSSLSPGVYIVMADGKALQKIIKN